MKTKDFYDRVSETEGYNLKNRISLEDRSGLKSLVAFDDRFLIVTETLERLIREKMRKNPVKILDIGCGDGVYETLLSENTKKVAEFYGTDISHQQLKKTAGLFKEIKINDIDNERLPFNDSTFDVVICSEVMEHVFEPERIITEARRVLKRNGVLVLTVPNAGFIGTRIGLLLTGHSPMINYPANKPHIRFYGVGDIEGLVKKSFKVSWVSGIGSLLFGKWNCGVKIPMPRFLQVLFNKHLPQLANGLLFVLERK